MFKKLKVKMLINEVLRKCKKKGIPYVLSYTKHGFVDGIIVFCSNSQFDKIYDKKYKDISSIKFNVGLDLLRFSIQ